MLGPVRPGERREAGAREATRGIQPSPAALARGPSGGCRVTGSQIRVEGSVRFYRALNPRERQPCLLGLGSPWKICLCLRSLRSSSERPVISAGSQILVCPPHRQVSLGQSLEAFSVLGPGSHNHAGRCLHLTDFSTSDPKEPDRERDRPIATTLRSSFVFCSCAGDVDFSYSATSKILCRVILSPPLYLKTRTPLPAIKCGICLWNKVSILL